MVNTRGTLWPSALTMLGCVSAAWMIRPMRVFFSSSQVVNSMPAGDQQHEAAIGREVLAVDREQREIERGRHAIRHRQHAPRHLHRAADDEHQAEGEQQLGDVAVVVHAPEPPYLDRRADRAAQQGRDQQAGQKPTQRLIW